MSYCVQPNCQNPQNPLESRFCQSCGSPLVLNKRYRPMTSLGKGGFGRTFLAIDESSRGKIRCVVKQFTFYDKDPELMTKAIDLFRQEASRLQELEKHPQIPKLLAYFEQAHLSYLVQEFIQGQTLKEELELEVYDEGKIWQLLKDLLPVLQFIHEHRIIHRDIKPDNIIRRRSDFKPVLIDFGIAKLLTDTALLRPATVIGSQDYVAPEQTKGKVFPASDIYSLGVTCIRLLTNVPPLDMYDFDAEKWWWSQFLPQEKKVNSFLVKILDKMLQPSLQKRYSSAQEVLEDVNHVLGASPLSFAYRNAEIHLQSNSSSISQEETLILNGDSASSISSEDDAETLILSNEDAETLILNNEDAETLISTPENDLESPIDGNAETLVLNGMEESNHSSISPVFRLEKPKFSIQSSHGINYETLQEFLATQHWKKADHETWFLLCKLVNIAINTPLDCHQIYQIPCEDLWILDQLWRYYSQNRFGWTVQKQIYDQTKRDYLLFCDQVKWSPYYSFTSLQQLQYNLQSPLGHLPSRCWVNGADWLRYLDVLSAKLSKCKST